MAKKRSVSTSRADREDDKRKRDSNRAENKRNSRRKKDIAAVATGVAAGSAFVARKAIRDVARKAIRGLDAHADYRQTRYSRLTGGGGAPGQGMGGLGQGSRGGGGFLRSSK